MTLRYVRVALLIGAALLLGSCGGGGGGGGGSNSTAPSNSWDSMVWDQGSWG
jgi:hypothetical protein